MQLTKSQTKLTTKYQIKKFSTTAVTGHKELRWKAGFEQTQAKKFERKLFVKKDQVLQTLLQGTRILSKFSFCHETISIVLKACVNEIVCLLSMFHES